MTFEADFSRLERTARGLNWTSVAFGVAAAPCLLIAGMLSPGDYGEIGRFGTIQIHLDLISYFQDLGIKTWLSENRMVAGLPLGQIRMAASVAQVLLTIFAIGSLLRLQWRPAVGAGLALGLSFLALGLADSRQGYMIADVREFAVRLPRVAAVLPVAARPERTSEEVTPEEQARAVRAQAIRAKLEGPMSDLSPAQRAAMHYTAAQIGYLEQDAGETARHRNAISSKDFDATRDADYRLRVVDEWLGSRGMPTTAGAYRPTTGIPFDLQRRIAGGLLDLGVLAGLLAFVAAELARRLKRRLKRMRELNGRLRLQAITVSRSLSPALAKPSPRELNPA